MKEWRSAATLSREEMDALLESMAEAKRAEEDAGLTGEEIAHRIQDVLDHSDDPVAQWYRRVVACKKQTVKP